MGWNRKGGVKLLKSVEGQVGGAKCHLWRDPPTLNPTWWLNGGIIFKKKRCLILTWYILQGMVKTAQNSAKPCPRNFGEFLLTLRPVCGARHSPAISPRVNETFQADVRCSGIKNEWFKLVKSVGVSGLGQLLIRCLLYTSPSPRD